MQKFVLYSTLVFSLALVLFVACSKDKYQDKPTIEIKSVDPSQVPLNSPLQMVLSFTDKQGDLDSVFLYKVRLNSKVKPVKPANFFNYKLPTFPEKSKGEIKITMDYNLDLVAAVTPNTQVGAPNDKEPDTLAFKIIVKDKAGNFSDTTVTDPIVVERYN
jgi:hypothetical protein